jgi:bacteriocin-like protein
MSDENRNEKEKGKEVQEESPRANQLSEQELKKVSGGGRHWLDHGRRKAQGLERVTPFS